MVNPDGVIIGNYRTCYSGCDLNRKYHNPDQRLHTTVYAIKNLVSEIACGVGLNKSEESKKQQQTNE